MLTQAEARELVTRSAFDRRAPHPEFIKSRLEARRIRRAACIEAPRPDDYRALWDEWIPLAGAASYANVILDTTAPASVTLSLNGGATYATSASVTATIATTDTPTTGYQMKIWGAVNTGSNANIQTTEGASTWITYGTSQAVVLSTGDGSKTINLKVRDDVWNESSGTSASITLDTTVPVATIQGGSPDVSKISTISGKRVVTIVWQSDTAYQAYEWAVVANGSSLRGSGTVIGSTNGSTNVSGTTGPATTNVTTTIDGRDLQAASGADGTKVLKVFVQDLAGNWSVA